MEKNDGGVADGIFFTLGKELIHLVSQVSRLSSGVVYVCCHYVIVCVVVGQCWYVAARMVMMLGPSASRRKMVWVGLPWDGRPLSAGSNDMSL